MLTANDVERASELLRRRRWISSAKWDAIVISSFDRDGYREPFDDGLAIAVEDFRIRRLAAIDAELRALGVDPTD